MLEHVLEFFVLEFGIDICLSMAVITMFCRRIFFGFWLISLEPRGNLNFWKLHQTGHKNWVQKHAQRFRFYKFLPQKMRKKLIFMHIFLHILSDIFLTNENFQILKIASKSPWKEHLKTYTVCPIWARFTLQNVKKFNIIEQFFRSVGKICQCMHVTGVRTRRSGEKL